MHTPHEAVISKQYLMDVAKGQKAKKNTEMTCKRFSRYFSVYIRTLNC